jgi:preprotein translocase subunit YajC
MSKTKLTPMEALKAIGNLLKMDFAKTEKFKSAKLEDGTEVMWDGEIGEGTAIMVVAEDGNQMPAPDATHVLEDGTKVTTVGGLVTMIEPKEKLETEVEVEMGDDTMKKMEERMASCESKMAEIESKMTEMFENYKNKFSAIDSTINNTTKSITEKFDAIKVIVDDIADSPIVETPKPTNITFKKKSVKSAAERIAEIKNSNK